MISVSLPYICEQLTILLNICLLEAALRNGLHKLSYTIRKYNPYLNRYSRSISDEMVEYTVDRAFQVIHDRFYTFTNSNINYKNLIFEFL